MNPERTLRAVADLAARLAVEWAAYETVEANLAVPTIAAAAGQSGRGSDVPDPVHSVAWSHVRYRDTCDLIASAHEALVSAARTMGSVRHHHSDIAVEHDRMIRALRCSPEIDPLCTELAARAGLCWKHYNLRRIHGADEARRIVADEAERRKQG
jgi:hypothetical protein